MYTENSTNGIIIYENVWTIMASFLGEDLFQTPPFNLPPFFLLSFWCITKTQYIYLYIMLGRWII